MFLDWLLLVTGLAVLLAGAEMLVRGASRLALAAGIPPLVTGLTVVAFGTSAPELCVGLGAALRGSFALASGNVVGSNIFNVFAVLGISACIAPLAVEREAVRLDVPAMLTATVLCWLALADGELAAWEAGLLLAAMLPYTLILLRRARADKGGDAAGAAPVGEAPGQTDAAAERPTRRSLTLSALAAVAGGVLLALGADGFVGAASRIAADMGVSEALIGATVAAAGTSLPELATSALAAFKGQRDLAVGNVLGSNIFNIFIVLGAAGLAAPAGTASLPPQMALDLPVMAAAAFLCVPVFVTGSRITRGEGLLFLAYFAVYLAARIALDLGLPWGLAASEHALPATLTATGLVYALSLGRTALRLGRQGGGVALTAVRKAAVLVAGVTVLLAGVVMLVTPGPGLAAIVLGLVILATEFMWAKLLLAKAKERFSRVAEQVKNGLKHRGD